MDGKSRILDGPASNDTFDDNCVVSIHKAVVSRLFPSFSSSNLPSEEKNLSLDALKNRRLLLESELARLRVTTTTVLASEKRVLHSRSEKRPYEELSREEGYANHKPVPSDTNMTRSTIQDMHSIRSKRRVVGSHRLAGISVLPSAEDDLSSILRVRLDISLRGRFVARHVLFFSSSRQILRSDTDVQKRNKDEPDYGGEENNSNTNHQLHFVKLLQHTLPTAVPVQDIVEQNLGKGGRLRIIEDSEEASGAATMHRIKTCVAELYDAAFGVAVRQDGVLFLKHHASNEKSGWENRFGVNDLSGDNEVMKHLSITDFQETNHRITFYMHVQQQQGTSIRIELCYDPHNGRAVPTVVVNTNRAIIEEGNTRMWEQQVRASFQQHLIPEAILRVAGAMLDGQDKF